MGSPGPIFRPLLLALILVAGGACGDDLVCGDGTRAEGDECVPDLTGDWDVTKPAVSLLEVAHLHIAEEGVRPIYLRHPVHLQVGIDVVGEPFTTDLVLGLRSKDGKKACIAGHAELTHKGRKEAEGDKTPATSIRLDVDARVYVQPFCKKLVGSKGVRAWLAIDPFGLLRIKGRKLPTIGAGEVDMAAFIGASTADLSGCKSPEITGHPDSCTTSLEVADTPGPDLQVLDVDLSSSVVLATESTLTVPDLYANTQVILYGDDGSKKLFDVKKPLDIGFRIRPEIDPIDLPKGASVADFDWQRVDVKKSFIDKEGKITRQDLRANFLSSLEVASQKMTDSALQFGQELRDLMNHGKWAKFSKYQLLACVEPDFDEAIATGFNHANNCALTTLVLARHGQPDGSPLGGHEKITVKEAEYESAADPKDPKNTCGAEPEYRPECTWLGQHLEETYCYEVPKYKITPLVDEDKCHCCYPPSAFSTQTVLQHAPSLRGGFGDDETVSLRSGIWFDVNIKKTSMFDGKPSSMGQDLGTDVRMRGWWDVEIAYVGAPAQIGLQPGLETYWWPELRLFGFALYSLKVVPEGLEWKLPVIPEKKWNRDFCQVFCATFACFECCAGFGGSVGVDIKAAIDEPGKKIAGTIEPFMDVNALGSAGLHLGVGVVGLELVFQPLIGFHLPFETNLTLIIESVSDPVKIAVQANLSVNFLLKLLAGKVNGFFKPAIGDKVALTLYEWEPLEYWYELWGTQHEWKLEL